MVFLENWRNGKMTLYTVYVKLENNEDKSIPVKKSFHFNSKVKIFQLKLGGASKLLNEPKVVFRLFKQMRYDFSILSSLTICNCCFTCLSHVKLIGLMITAPLLQEFFFEKSTLTEALMTNCYKLLETSQRKVNFILFKNGYRNLDERKENKSMYLLAKIAQHGFDRFHMQFSTAVIGRGKMYFFRAVDQISRTKRQMKVYVGSHSGWQDPIIKYCHDIGLELYMNPWQKHTIE